MKHSNSRRSGRAIPLFVASVLASAAAGIATAQDATDSGDKNALAEVTVTGSRITGRDLESNSPIVTVAAESLVNVSQATVDEALKRLPQFAASGGQTAAGRAFGDTGLATVNLRNLGSNRNLVLLDGRRMQPSSSNFSVDVNTVPSALIQSIEVISGGASAAYGSDAISGVVNFKLRTDFDGVEVSVKAGTSQRGDYDTKEANLLAGTNMADGRGNIVLGLNLTKRGGVWSRDVEFFQRGLAAGASSNGFLGTGYFNQDFMNPPSPTAVAAALGGAGVPGEAIGFNTDNTTLFGVSSALNYHSGLYPENFRYAINSVGAVGYNLFGYDYAVTPLERYAGFARATLAVSENTQAYLQGTYSHYTIEGIQFPALLANFWNATVLRDGQHPTNAPFEALLNSRPDPTAPWTVDRAAEFVGPVPNLNTNQNFQVVAGLRGEIAGTSLKWDVYGSHGQTDISTIYESGFVSTTRYRELMAAPFYGAGYSQNGATCTSGISPFAPLGSTSQDCLDFMGVTPKNSTTQEQNVFEANLQGEAVNLPAGALLFAVGTSYRKNTYRADTDDSLQSDPSICQVCTDVPGNFGIASTLGSTDVKELYGELIVPLLKDLPLVRSLQLGLAYRYSDYDTVGGVNTFKGDLSWSLNDAFRVRGGYQRAVRAPNPIELFSGAQSQLGVSVTQQCVNAGPFAADATGNNPANPNQAKVQALCAALTPGGTLAFYQAPYLGGLTPFILGTAAGNPNLSQETADTITFGFVFRPDANLWLNSKFNASVDYYDIKIDDAIGVLLPQDAYNKCFNRNGVSNPTYDPSYIYCRAITVSSVATGARPLNVANVYQNQGGLKTRGIDVALNWSLPAGPGTLKFVWQTSFLLDFDQSQLPGEPFLQYAGYSNDFKTRSLLTAGYAWNHIDFGGRLKYLSSTHDITCVGAALCSPDAASYSLVDFFTTYHLSDSISVNFGVDNLLNRDPVITGGVLGQTNAGEYDTVGRNYYLGVRAKF